MLPIQLCSTQKETKKVDFEFGLISRENYISYLIFFILFFLQDIALLILFSPKLKYLIPKLSINLVIIAIMVVQAKRLRPFCINVFLVVSKATSILFVYILGQDYLLIVLFILEENQINIEPWENFIQRVFIKIGCFLLILIQFNIMNIIILASILALEIYKLIYHIQCERNSQQSCLNCQMIKIKSGECLENSKEINKVPLIPLCYILISRKDLTIKYKNDIFYSKFSTICKSQEEFDELILQKMTFQIISQYFDEQQNMSTELYQQKKRLTKHRKKQNLNIDENLNQNFTKIQKENNTLKEILENYKLEQAELGKVDKQKQITLDIYSQYYQEQNNYQAFTGQIIINNDEDDILLTLIDVSNQNKFQEVKLKDQFATSIVQSFSHELRTPLNSSLNFLQCCENDKSIDEDIRINFITPAISALRLQSYLINDIIDFSSICSDNFEADITNVTMEQIVDEINKLFKSVLELKNIVLYIDLTENELKFIGTDFSRLMQIISNILSNSIKYSNQGVILIKIASSSSNHLKIQVKDEGFGIEETRLEQIQKVLYDLEDRQYLSEYQSWNGFGLLISSMLLKKICPPEQKVLLVTSQGLNQGTNITFFIKNQQLSYQSSQCILKDQSINPKLRISLKSGSIQPISINGSLIQISELSVPNKNGNIRQTSKMKKSTYKSGKSGENSVVSESFIDLDFQLQIGEIYNFDPFLFSKSLKQNVQNEQSTSKQFTKILSYNQMKQQEEQESELQMKQALKKFKCTCNRILSVDDEIFNQKSIQFLLQQQGFEVVLAFNGEEAINILKETKKCSSNCCLYLLILMDYQMPIMNGIRTTQTLKQMMTDNLLPSINVIGLTAFNSKKDIENCLNSGMSTVLTKPLIIAELFEILKQI